MNLLLEFEAHLMHEEKSRLTIEKYLRDVGKFLIWIGEKTISKETVLEYKESLVELYEVTSVNSMLSSLNSYFDFINRPDFRVKNLRRQRQAFLPEGKELSREEYNRLIKAAAAKPRLCLLMQTICSTGIRVSEHKFITVEAARAGRAEVRLKGKVRTVFLPGKLCGSLLKYAREHRIASGSIFVTASGKPLDRCNIWAEMKKLCHTARVSREKVFPHNLRHLFARLFYAMDHDIVRLADVLGHSSINTTRIYTMESGATHRRQIEKLDLMCCIT